MLAYAVATGLVVVGFTLLADAASSFFGALIAFRGIGSLLFLAWTPGLTTAVLWCTYRFAPGAVGSGIPQVVAALSDEMPSRIRLRLVSLPLALYKVVLVSGGLLAGLSIGREGPTVQVGAGVMQHARRWLRSDSVIDPHDLIVAGAAAGIAAAFNTPLGGVIFALEQLSRRRGFSHTSIVIIAIVLAGLVAVSAFGNATYFGELSARDARLVLPCAWVPLGRHHRNRRSTVLPSHRRIDSRTARSILALARQSSVHLCCGMRTGRRSDWCCERRDDFRRGIWVDPRASQGHAQLPVTYTLLKFCATWISAWSGVPAGVFAPALAIGAGIGRDVASLTGLTAMP